MDSLSVLGNVLEEFMDVPHSEDSEDFDKWKSDRERVVKALEEDGLRYFRGGRVLPAGQSVAENIALNLSATTDLTLKPV